MSVGINNPPFHRRTIQSKDKNLIMSKNQQEERPVVRRGMMVLGGFYGLYFAVGFVYPPIMGQNVLRKVQRRLGGIDPDSPVQSRCSHEKGR